MSVDQDPNGEAQERATVRLVSEQIRGLERLTDAGFKDMQRQLDAVAVLPVTVARLEAQNVDQEKRLEAIEGRMKGDSEWRRTHLPTILLTLALVAVAVVGLLTQVHP